MNRMMREKALDANPTMQLGLRDGGLPLSESDEFLTQQLITYIGNKRRLLPWISKALLSCLDLLNVKDISFADVFAGTGAVSRLARQCSHSLFINDFEKYSSLINSVYHANYRQIDLKKIDKYRRKINEIASKSPREGFITKLYAPADEANISPTDRVFYTRRNAMFIDTARQELEAVPKDIRDFILAPLIQRSSVHVNTSGVFKGFYKNEQGIGQFGGSRQDALQRICSPIEIPLPVFSDYERNVTVSCEEASNFVRTLPPTDVAYFDPPYNQHPYGSNYFMLNLILNYKEPEKISRVSGIPNDWLRSDYNVRGKARGALIAALTACPARILLVSYNSEGFISFEEMLESLDPLGNLTVFDSEYNTFRGCRNLSQRSSHVTEYLFRVERRR